MRTDGQTDTRTDERTDMAKLIVAFRNFVNARNNTQTIGPQPDTRTLSKGPTSTDELLYTDDAAW